MNQWSIYTWWRQPRAPLFDEKGRVMPNWQNAAYEYSPPRAVVLCWTKYSKTHPGRVRQYALWTSGEIITRTASGERRFGLWQERSIMRFNKRNIQALNRLLLRNGYKREYLAPTANFIVSRRINKSV